MTTRKIVIHTDVFLDHLVGERSALREAMQHYFCYTTVFQAIELFSLARTPKEIAAIEDSMAAVKVLGLNARNARKYGHLISSNKKITGWNILIAGLCLDSRLPLLTNRKKDFAGIKKLRIVSADSLLKD